MLYDYRLAAPATLTRVSAYPTEVTGGEIGYAAPMGVVLLDGRAPKGARVTLRSSQPAVASVPSFVKVSKGWSNAHFQIITREVTSTKVVELTATYGGVTRRVSITVHP